MVNILFEEKGRVVLSTDVRALMDIPRARLLWVDLVCPEDSEKQLVENLLRVQMQTKQESEEIESSSRFFETNDQILANTYVLVPHDNSYVKESVSMILKEDLLVTHRQSNMIQFTDVFKKLEIFGRVQGAHQLILSMFEYRIDQDADFIENLAKEIAAMGRDISIKRDLDESVVLKIAEFQELTMLMRECIIDKQRVLSAVLRSDFFPTEYDEKLRIILKDVQSLLSYAEFNFERLEYIQNTFMSLVDLEQSKVTKIFTVATVVFMPPTLIASIYGMNYQFMPELGWKYGYLFALCLMVLSSVSTLVYFRGKKWL